MAEFPTLEDVFEPIEGKSGTEANEQMRRWYAGTRQLPGAAPTAAISIVDDGIAPTSADIIVDTEGQAPADDLQIIQTSSTHDGMRLSLRAASPDRIVTVIATGQLNGITLWNRAERYVLSTSESLVLQRDGGMWREVRGVGVALAEDAQLTLENTEMAARASQLASLYFRTATLEGGIASLSPTSADAGKLPMVDSVGGFVLSDAIKQAMYVRDEKPSGAAGGTFTTGGWRTRDLNTILVNDIPGASLANNQITLPAGRYEVDARAPAFAVNRHVASLYNVGDGTLIVGSFTTAPQVPTATYVQTDGIVKAVIKIASQSVFELRHYCETTVAVNGFGVGTFLDGSAFSDVKIRRIA